MAAVDDFLRKVMRSGLLHREQLQNALRSLVKGRRDDVGAVIEHLIQAGKLTRFQAYKLQQGITLGLVLGHYQILVPLGRGGMGTVYLAVDARTDQHVALKILPPKIARTEERLLARFQREMELSQKIKHPHLARTVEAGIHQGIHFIAMEYIPGRTLYRIVTGQGPLQVGRAAHLFAETASALAQAHGQGVIHRDMKPSNIMVTPHDHAKVLDLGLAFTEGEEVEDIEVVGGKGYIVGSIDYMAPEQTRDPTNIDIRADIYALGCCMYFGLTGKPPFPYGSLYDKIKAHRHEPAEPIRNKYPQIPEAFAAIVHRMLAKNPSDRFASAVEVAYALEPWREAPPLALDTPGDEAYQRSVRDVITLWTPPEAKETDEDAVLFRIEPEERTTPVDPGTGSIFRDIDRVQPQIWLLAIVGVWVALLMLCVVGSCLFTWLR
ncbi:MAG TPA: serine/threonine-protein kinase [Gemmataceae bacterium]|nr:serine/threonine-protein kinase [Gemmataceae bacterium]